MRKKKTQARHKPGKLKYFYNVQKLLYVVFTRIYINSNAHIGTNMAAAARKRTAQRKMIIKCCGKASCLNMTPKKRPTNTTILTKTSGYFRSTPAISRNKANHTLQKSTSSQDVQSSGYLEEKTSAEGPTLPAIDPNVDLNSSAAISSTSKAATTSADEATFESTNSSTETQTTTSSTSTAQTTTADPTTTSTSTSTTTTTTSTSTTTTTASSGSTKAYTTVSTKAPMVKTINIEAHD